jgi:hypothetical protein
MNNTYDYRGYVITEVPSGYFITNGYTFFSYDEACDWIDDQIDGIPDIKPNLVPELHLYHIFYVTRSYDQGYDEYIQAYSENEAIRKLKRQHRDIAYIADISEVD